MINKKCGGLLFSGESLMMKHYKMLKLLGATPTQKIHKNGSASCPQNNCPSSTNYSFSKVSGFVLRKGYFHALD